MLFLTLSGLDRGFFAVSYSKAAPRICAVLLC